MRVRFPVFKGRTYAHYFVLFVQKHAYFNVSYVRMNVIAEVSVDDDDERENDDDVDDEYP